VKRPVTTYSMCWLTSWEHVRSYVSSSTTRSLSATSSVSLTRIQARVGLLQGMVDLAISENQRPETICCDRPPKTAYVILPVSRGPHQASRSIPATQQAPGASH
jgi:hypothetical protein